MAAQRAAFTVPASLSVPIDEAVPSAFPVPDGPTINPEVAKQYGLPAYPPSRPADVLKKFVVAGSIRSEALTRLDQMGIAADALFPGLDGIGVATQHMLHAGRWRVRDLLDPRSSVEPNRPVTFRWRE
jgi:hypothetical protein